ncbi:nucleotidyl transferase AbiEii/AbiGii toxin family protein [Aquimarina macrocephali]|uniref:nucleotidyl transferase AbiEii/AbiGii toxin family protein n=1 Tax=Aquimarina macrocephali TaxID=666563 RepID=UPI000467B123|nr:nucleotidyl transferase AbiEii/AbiGii toxin family protein [Aquimarina macrocephali]
MKKQTYKNQVSLLLNVIPEVAKEECFALHGGTAINLFVRNMPRLSVDIDLTYVPIEDRAITLKNIADALERIKSSIESVIPEATVEHKQDISKLQISFKGAQIKLEVNQTNRGLLEESQTLELCDDAQKEFDVFCAIQTVSLAQLYGGKICAALDRQHPRDLFDIKYLLKNEGFTEEIKTGFLFYLLCSNRKISDLLTPNRLDQRKAMENQFDGMSDESFTYEDFEATRESLIEAIQNSLNEKDKQFLLSFKSTEPDWSIYNFEKFPSVQWKLQNLQGLRKKNPEKHILLVKQLKDKLSLLF